MQILICARCGAGKAPHDLRAVLAYDAAGLVRPVAQCQCAAACRERLRRTDESRPVDEPNRAA
jgi:hypothetical protein